jgi:hypothetical protein
LESGGNMGVIVNGIEVDRLWQIHHHDITKQTTKMVAQNSINTKQEMDDWFADVSKRHPLPKGCGWLLCQWDSKYFVKATI